MTDISSQTLHIVAKELTVTLNDARASLEGYAERSDQRAQLERCADQLHSAHGVLRLVEVQPGASGADLAHVVTTAAEVSPRISPNGKWLAYTSNESGRSEVYVQSVTEPKGRYLISNAGGFEPQWRADGKELFYSELATPARIMAVDVDEKNGVLKPGIPHGLFEVALGPAGAGQPTHRWVVSRDGQKAAVQDDDLFA